MKIKIIMNLMLLSILLIPNIVSAQVTPIDPHLIEIRYCGVPARYADGAIKRRTDVIREFERRYPLPEGFIRDEWEVDHTLPLALGGCDAVWNMQWLPKTIKRCSRLEPTNKDCFERKIYPNIINVVLDKTQKGVYSIFQVFSLEDSDFKLENRSTLYPPVILQPIPEPIIIQSTPIQ